MMRGILVALVLCLAAGAAAAQTKRADRPA